MPQISKGDTFTDGEQLTAARLNQLLDSAICTENLILDQPTVSAPVNEADYVLSLHGGVLSKIDLNAILNSGIAVSTSVITGQLTDGSGANINLIPLGTGTKVTVIGNLDIPSGTLNAGGNSTIGGTLTVTGATTLTGGINGNTTINGNFTIGSGKTLTLAQAPTSDLQAATKAYADGPSPLKTNNGYFKLPNGLIVQWGRGISQGTYSTQTIVFPTPFLSQVLHIQVSGSTTSTAGGFENNWKYVEDTSTTLTQFQCFNAYTGSTGTANKPFWIAIGF